MTVPTPIFTPRHADQLRVARVLLAAGDLDALAHLLPRVIAAMEAEARAGRGAVLSWPYDVLARIYAGRRAWARELAVLERYARQPSAWPGRFQTRIERARGRLVG